MSFLYKLLEWALSNGGQKVLQSLGVFIASSSVLLTLSDAFIDRYITMADSMPAEVLGLLNLVGFDNAIAYVLSAIATRAAFDSFSARLIKS